MADIQPTELLDGVKSYLNITWEDAATDAKITGYISRGMARLQQIAGAPLDFTAETQPRALLLDYCRYANAQALEVFEQNFVSELFALHVECQAPVLPPLSLSVKAGSTPAGVTVSVIPPLNDGDNYVYTVGETVVIPAHMSVCSGTGYTAWDGVADIPAVAGQQVLIVETDYAGRAVAAGMVTV